MENHINVEEMAALDKLLHSYMEAYIMNLNAAGQYYFPYFFGYGMEKLSTSNISYNVGVAHAIVTGKYNRLVEDLIKNLPVEQHLVCDIINKYSKDDLSQFMPNLSTSFDNHQSFNEFLTLISGQVKPM